MWKYISAAVASGMIVASGLVHGLWTDRWVPAVEPLEAAKRFENIPMVLGEWQGEAIEHEESRPEFGIVGALQRRYVNQRSGDVVLIALVCGRPGPISIHTPDACYAASGFNVGKSRRVESGQGGATFWFADAVRTRVTEETRLRIYWAWNRGGGWTASDNPRFEFAREPVLHKLYIIRELEKLDGRTEATDPCETFMEVLLPELDRVLFSAREVE